MTVNISAVPGHCETRLSEALKNPYVSVGHLAPFPHCFVCGMPEGLRANERRKFGN